MTEKRWTEVLCQKCGGNGVIKIPNGIAECPRCHQGGFDPVDAPTSETRLLTECCAVWIATDYRFCPKCGHEARVAEYPNDVAPPRNYIRRDASPTHDSGDWLYTDEFGSVWRLRPTGDRDNPLDIIAEKRA